MSVSEDSSEKILLLAKTRKRSEGTEERDREAYRALSENKVEFEGKELRKVLKFRHLFAYIVGILIGSGIFISPSLIARQSSNSGVALLIWFISGIPCVFGAVCLCELAVSLKKSGGMFMFINETYGKTAGFFAIWTVLFVAFPSGTAVVAVATGQYVTRIFYDIASTEGVWLVKAIAIFTVLLSVLLNMVSTSFGSKTQILFTSIQAFGLLFFVGVGIWNVANGNTENYMHMFDNSSDNDAASMGLALYSGLWSYEGWGAISTVSEEIQDLKKDLLLSLVTGIPFVMVCYALANLSFISVLTHDEIASSETIATTFIEKSLGTKAGVVMPVIVSFICFGCINATIFSLSRLFLSAGREGHLPEPTAYIHTNRRTPIPALILMFVLVVVWILILGSGTMTLVTYFSFANWMLYGMSILAVIILRFRQPELPRPFKVWIINPIIMTIISLYLVIAPFAKSPVESSICLGLLLISVPIHFLMSSKRNFTPDVIRKGKETLYNLMRHHMSLEHCVFKAEVTATEEEHEF